jgi:hypothetical protein
MTSTGPATISIVSFHLFYSTCTFLMDLTILNRSEAQRVRTDWYFPQVNEVCIRSICAFQRCAIRCVRFPQASASSSGHPQPASRCQQRSQLLACHRWTCLRLHRLRQQQQAPWRSWDDSRSVRKRCDGQVRQRRCSRTQLPCLACHGFGTTGY